MAEIRINIEHDSIEALERVVDILVSLSIDYNYNELSIDTGLLCISKWCTGNIVGEYDQDGWHYCCDLCGRQMELIDNTLQPVIL